ncbi:hypothetical protein F4694_006081 [Bacillus niacini]|uniref:Uncharacterized protein n=1 Tax=Neobacillus niacini TaxID=86668 RepID=A0A852TQS3_9BACI|nr:hypothetical protein [Neobacillus niacini]NYE09224.1 hypothetical protein [Neobacillus niacini]
MTSAKMFFKLLFSHFIELNRSLTHQPMCVVPLKELIHMKLNGIQIPLKKHFYRYY